MLPTPKRLKAQSPSHARAKKQEKETAERIGAKLTKGSGSGYEGGDSRKRRIVRIENKTTKRASFSVTEALIEDLEQKVFGADEIPIIQIELRLGARKVIVMPDWALDFIVEALEKYNERK
jgi:hypothetical protein